jgi:hypothetical protein
MMKIEESIPRTNGFGIFMLSTILGYFMSTSLQMPVTEMFTLREKCGYP